MKKHNIVLSKIHAVNILGASFFLQLIIISQSLQVQLFEVSAAGATLGAVRTRLVGSSAARHQPTTRRQLSSALTYPVALGVRFGPQAAWHVNTCCAAGCYVGTGRVSARRPW